ncbi:hypothetical protein PHET_11591 [Paragonimus heterotremus]|uniref:Uncharacterized protein n=1 Tax=Paragonimus heterotremus TaxID=100268 RepID=A0A8J4WDG7_9TREM|nr:hypothetical protein PHET_11591 [Paragonimus heterotremus]
MVEHKQKSTSLRASTIQDILAPADILLYISLVIGVLGLMLCLAGIGLLAQSGLTAHLSLVYVGAALLLAALITGFIAVRRIVLTNKRLRKMGLTASEFISKWNGDETKGSAQGSSGSSYISQLSDSTFDLQPRLPEPPTDSSYARRLPMAARRADI